MFDKYVLNPGGGSHSHYHKTEVTEKRAPTDESVKLLREMEQKALDQIVDGFLIQGNSLELVALETVPSGFRQPRIYYAFKLNGQRFDGWIDSLEALYVNNDPHEAARIIINSMAQAIAGQLLEKGLIEGHVTRWSY